MNRNSKGSEWHQWDLHFHTPSSYDYKDKSVSDADIINTMKSNSISAFAITDHHIIDVDRYKRLKELGEIEGITVLPGIEFLSDSKGKDPVHFIAIFSEESNIEHIWGQIKNRTDIHKVDSCHMKENAIYCHLMDTIKLIKELGGIVTIHAGEKSGSVENISHSLPHGIAQKSDIAQTVDIYELGKESDQTGYRDIVFPHIGKTLPMIICSDNHNAKKYQLKQKMWIKGEPTFKGLKYALNEPLSRFYIGNEPEILKRVKTNPNKYIKSININRTGKHESNSIWFEDISIPLNNELVTIIGHKGSGKSALSDIIALCCDADHSDDYIFLNKNKFKKKGLADRFSAFVEFSSGQKTEIRSLSHSVDNSNERLVRYLPQSYFEKLCNEIDKVDAFRAEIEKVVFQYVPEEKRIGTATFKELIDYKKLSAEKEINHLREQLLDLNSEIIELENLADPAYKNNLISKIKIKQDELQAHNDTCPIAINDPSTQTESDETRIKKNNLQRLESEKLQIESHIHTVSNRIIERNKFIIEAERLNRELANKYNELQSIIEKSTNFSLTCGFDISKAISVIFNEDIIKSKINTLKGLNESDTKLISPDDNWKYKPYEQLSLASKLEQLKDNISKIQSEFTGEQKIYQEYLISHKQWEKRRNEILGSTELHDSLINMQERLAYINNNLETIINEKRLLRINKSIDILSKKKEIQSFYDEVKEEISSKLSQSDVSGLSIASSFYCSHDFKNVLLRNVKQNRIGSFYGSDDGATLLQEELINTTDWNDIQSVKSFLSNFINYLEFDKRHGSNNEKLFIGDVTKNREELYSYLFGLDFIEPHYDLRQRGKSLEQLSPGEKGALLLVFYLVLDKEDIPLIIDQPEDNLDNNSVAKVLVPYIKEAKKKRQILMVTHNPNLAVVADSEQVIKVNIEKDNGNRYSFISGGIECTLINEQIVEVLEGTIPAFSLRKNKYQIS